MSCLLGHPTSIYHGISHGIVVSAHKLAIHHHQPIIRGHDVREQLCGGRAALLVLGRYCMAGASRHKGVCIVPAHTNLYLPEYSSQVRGPSRRFFSVASIAVLVTARVARRWNQTGQKFAGDPDIARTFFSEHKATLWIAVVGAYLWNLRSLANRGFSLFSQNISGGIATALATASATFKLAFTSQDSPELMAGPNGPLIAGELSLPLVTRARIAFAAIGFALVYTLITGFSLKKRPNRKCLLL